MNFNNSIIRQMGFISFLVCNSKSVKFYKKNNWKILNKKKFEIADHPFSKIGMVFNKYNKIKKILFYFNK